MAESSPMNIKSPIIFFISKSLRDKYTVSLKNVFDIVLIVKKILEIVFIFEERIFVRGV